MIDFIKKGPESFCTVLGNAGLDCSVSILTITLWHLILGAIVFFLVFGIAFWIRSYGRLDRQDNIGNVTAPYAAIDLQNTIRLHPYTLATALKKPAYLDLTKSDAAKKLNERYGKKYFVVEFHEGGKKILAKDVKLNA